MGIFDAVLPIAMLTMFIGVPPWELFQRRKIVSTSMFLGANFGALLAALLWYVTYYS
jgi:hypothetical protein